MAEAAPNENASDTAKETTDKEYLEEYNVLFGESETIETKGPLSDTNFSVYAPLGEISDDFKISTMKNLENSKNTYNENQAFVDKQATERQPTLKAVATLLELIENSNNSTEKAALQNVLDEMKPQMAEYGIFLEDDKRDRELVDKWLEKAEEDKKNFQSDTTHVSYVGEFSSMVTNVGHTSTDYKISNYLEYSCGGGIICKTGPYTYYVDSGDSTSFSDYGPIPNDLILLNTVEWISEIKNQMSGWAYQGIYYQGIHYDSNWNYQSGNIVSGNIYIASGATYNLGIHSVFNASIGDQTYLYGFIQ